MKDYLKLRILLVRSNKQMKIMMLIGLILITCLFFYNQLMDNQEQLFINQRLSEQKKQHEKMLDFHKNQPGPISEKAILFNQKNIDGILSFQNKDSLTYLKYEKQMIRDYYILEPLRSNMSSIPLSVENSKEIGFNIYDFLDGKEQVINALIKQSELPDSLRYGTKNWTFILSLQNFLTSFIGILFFLVTFSFIFFKDFEKKTINLLGTQPIKRTQIFACDFLLFVAYSLFYYSFAICYAYLIATLLGGKVSPFYPIMTNHLEPSLINTPIWQVIAITSGLFLLNLVFCYLLLTLIILISKKIVISLIITFLIISILSFISLVPVPSNVNKVTAYNPFIYATPQTIFIQNSHETIGDIWEIYGETDDQKGEYVSYECHLFYENSKYYLGNNIVKTTKNTYISWQRGTISLVLSILLLTPLVSNSYKKRMCF